MPKVLRDYEVYLVYVDPDRCDSCEQCLIMCPTDVFEMPHKAIPAGRRAAVSIDKYLGGDGKLEVGSRNAEFGSEDTQIGIN
jgi:NAD-dependent dihydropyrimidine dehydrogenase PreA subunit